MPKTAKPKIVVVGTKNPVKIAATSQSFRKIWPDIDWQVIGESVESNVSAQPMSPEESLKGATNRALAALDSNKQASFGVGLEGGLEKVNGYWFDCGWCVVVDRQKRKGVATSARIPTPESIMQHIRDGKELGEAIDLIFNRKNAKQAEGQFGLMTDGAITRTDGYVHAVCLALSRFLHPDLFDK